MAVTPNYSWPVPVNTDYVKDGAEAIKDLGDAIDSTVFGLPSGGLTLIKTQAIDTAVTSVNVTSAFSATYDNYLIKVSGTDFSADDVILRMTLNGSAGSTYQYGGTTTTSTGVNTVISGSALSSGFYVSPTGASDQTSIRCDVYLPFPAQRTTVLMESWGNAMGLSARGMDNNAVSHTGFSFVPASGTMTGGTIRVYGYQN